MIMSIHSIFSENLRHACTTYPSIAAVCTGIGINRQQFNKYLAGSTLPNAITLRKICNFLEVPEQNLFHASKPIDVPAGQKSKGVGGAASVHFAEELARSSSANSVNFQTGTYFSYFPLVHAPGMLLRSLVSVKEKDGSLHFTRITVFPSFGKVGGIRSVGKHRGIVLSNGDEFYFLGTNIYPPFQISLMTLQRVAGSREFYRGMTVTRSGRELISPQTCLAYCDQRVPLRDLLRQLGFLHCQKSELDSVFLAELLEQHNLS
jgi:transcriptional regulator with XRE-family HTH domain